MPSPGREPVRDRAQLVSIAHLVFQPLEANILLLLLFRISKTKLPQETTTTSMQMTQSINTTKTGRNKLLRRAVRLIWIKS
jgi:hypothetical protein